MKAELDDRKRDFLLGKLRVAMRLQIKLWDVAAAIEELAACELQEVLDFVNAAAITAETGMELSSADLDEFLKIGIPGRISTGAVWCLLRRYLPAIPLITFLMHSQPNKNCRSYSLISGHSSSRALAMDISET